MGNIPSILLILIITIAIVLIVSWIIMPWKVIGISDETKALRSEIEDLKEIQILQLKELKKMNGEL